MSNELQTSGAKTVAQFLNGANTKKYLEGLLQDRVGQFITSLVSLSNTTYGLTNVEPKSLMFCGLKAAALDLPLDNNLGFAYAVPYKNTKLGVTEAQFQMGWKGYVQLAQRTSLYKNINVLDIREGELKKWDPFTEELELDLNQDPEQREKLPIIGYAGYFILLNGFMKVSYWAKPKVERHGKRYSKSYSYNTSAWQSNFDAMAAKTVIKNLLSKWGPLSTEMKEAIKFDQSVIRGELSGEQEPEYVDASEFMPESEVPDDDLAAEFARQKTENKVVDGEIVSSESTLFDEKASLELDAQLAAEEEKNGKSKGK